MIKSLFRKKNVDFIRSMSGKSKLNKTLGLVDLTALGIGAIIGVGVFVLTGLHASQTAGPAITLSFILAGMTCIFVALAYTEVASLMPSSGGAYTYTYAAIGEVAAWAVGWMIIVQFVATSTTVAIGWSHYVLGVLKQLNIHIPEVLTKSPLEGGIINLPAVLIVLFLTSILIKGIKESSTFNLVLVIIKLGAIAVFLAVAAPHVDFQNWNNFMPFGWDGVTLAGASLFIAYTGFDAIANAAEESKNPRDVTISLIGSITLSAVLYVLVAGVLTAIVPYYDLNNAEPLAYALKVNGSNIGGAIVAVGGIAGMTTVILVQLYAGGRVLMAMSRDGMMPKVLGKIHKKFLTPYVATIAGGLVSAALAGFMKLRVMGDLNSMATLCILMFVVFTTVKLRITKPHVKRPFRCPMLYPIAFVSFICCGYLAYSLLETVGKLFVGWMALGFAVYFIYMRKQATKIYASNH